MKRFWQTVSIEGGEVMLDGRPVRTPGRVPLAVPYPSLADAIADEWRAVSGEIDPRSMPLTGLANAAIDRIAPDPGTFAAGLARYGESDLLCYRADGPAALIDRQRAAWDPLLDWAQQRYDVHFEVTTGIIHRAQPEATIARLGEAVAVPIELYDERFTTRMAERDHDPRAAEDSRAAAHLLNGWLSEQVGGPTTPLPGASADLPWEDSAR